MAYNDLATSEAVGGEYALALGNYQKSEQWDSTLAGLEKNLGICAYRMKDYAETVHALSQALPCLLYTSGWRRLLTATALASARASAPQAAMPVILVRLATSPESMALPALAMPPITRCRHCSAPSSAHRRSRLPIPGLTRSATWKRTTPPAPPTRKHPRSTATPLLDVYKRQVFAFRHWPSKTAISALTAPMAATAPTARRSVVSTNAAPRFRALHPRHQVAPRSMPRCRPMKAQPRR